MTGTPLTEALLFCLFSFLFGIFLALFRAFFQGILSALRLLPREGGGAEKRRFFLGYLFFDLFFFLIASFGYMIFLYALSGGVFRFYSLVLVALGFYFCHSFAHRFVFRPVSFVFSRFFSLLVLPWVTLFRLLRKRIRKKPKQLDETGKMV